VNDLIVDRSPDVSNNQLMILLLLVALSLSYSIPPAVANCRVDPKPIKSTELSPKRVREFIQTVKNFPKLDASSPQWDVSGFGYEVDLDNDGKKEIYLGYTDGSDHVFNNFVLVNVNGEFLYDKDFPHVKEGYNIPDEFLSTCGKTFIKNGDSYFFIKNKKMVSACDVDWIMFYRDQVRDLRKYGKSKAADRFKNIAEGRCKTTI
jgi:hypothetical protein